MNTSRIVFRNLTAQTLSQFISMALSFVFVICVANALGVFGFGQYSFAMGFIVVFQQIANLGLDFICIRDVAKDRTKAQELFSINLGLKLILSIISFLLLILVVALWKMPMDTKQVTILLGFSLIPFSINMTVTDIFQGFEKTHYNSITTTLINAIRVGASFLVLILGGGLFGIIVVQVIVTILQLVINYPLLRKLNLFFQMKFDPIRMKELIQVAIPLAISGFLGTVCSRSAVFALQVYPGLKAVGIYSAAGRYTDLLYNLLSVCIMALFPTLARLSESSNRYEFVFQKILGYLIAGAFLVAVMVTFTTRQIIGVTFKPEYRESAFVLQVIIWSLAFAFIYEFLVVRLIIEHKQKWVAWVNAIALMSYFLLYPVMIWKYQIMGAAYTNLIVGFLILLIHLKLGWKYISKANIGIVWKPAVVGGLLALFLYYLPPMNFFITGTLGTLFFIILLFAIKAVGTDEFTLLRQLFKNQ